MSKRSTLLFPVLYFNFALFVVMVLHHPDKAAVLLFVFLNNTALIWSSYEIIYSQKP